MSKPGGDPSSGISSGDVLILSERHPACRRREARPGSGMERENLTGDGKGKGTSGSNREAESTDAPERGGLPRSSAEAAVMAVERRGQAIDVEVGQPVRRDEPIVQRKAAAFMRWHEPDAQSFRCGRAIREPARAEFAPDKGEVLVMVPLILDRGRPVRANISLDAGLLEAIDEEAERRGLTRSAFFTSAALEKVGQTS
jgi:Ribbon-helix-helix protein, copG family